jgi:hypothetical protein
MTHTNVYSPDSGTHIEVYEKVKVGDGDYVEIEIWASPDALPEGSQTRDQIARVTVTEDSLSGPKSYKLEVAGPSFRATRVESRYLLAVVNRASALAGLGARPLIDYAMDISHEDSEDKPPREEELHHISVGPERDVYDPEPCIERATPCGDPGCPICGTG